MRGALGEDAALFDAHDFGLELDGLFDVAGDGEDGDVAFGGEETHGAEALVAEGTADTRKWLI